MRTLVYGIKQGIKNIMQNKGYSLAAIGTIATCIFLFTVFYALISNFQNMLYNAESSIGISVFFDEDIDEAKIKEIGESIKSCYGVKSITYISAEAAWEKFSSEMYDEEDNITDTFGNDNPLENSASYEVFMDDISNQSKLADYIESLEGVRKVNSSATASQSMSNINLLLAYVSGAVIILLLFVSAFLISSAVANGVKARKDELIIMKLVGATDFFMSIPFLVEGIIIGCIGAAIPLIIFILIYERIVNFVVVHFTILDKWLAFIGTKEELMVILPVSLLVGIGVGFVGSAVSVIRNKKEVIR